MQSWGTPHEWLLNYKRKSAWDNGWRKKINLALADKITEFSNALLAAHAKPAHASSACVALGKKGPCTREILHTRPQICTELRAEFD